MKRGPASSFSFGLWSFPPYRRKMILVDGAPATMADGHSTVDHPDIGLLGRAEVMCGPAAAMYGDGGGGAPSFHTAAPPDVPARQGARAVFGENGLMRFQSITSGMQGGASYLVSA